MRLLKNLNWSVRFKNKTTLTSIILAIIALIYQGLGLFGVVPKITQNDLIEVAGMVINLFVLLGVVVDPTTEGITDSIQALEYSEPKKEE